MDTNKNIFNIIDTLRFPLIVIVLYMHIIDIKPVPVTYDITGWNLYHFIIELVSHNLGLAVVPCFFLFSGFLFYYGTNNKTNNWFFVKLESRTRTIALPFLLWNIIFLVVSFLKVKVGLFFNLHNASIEYNSFLGINKLNCLWVDPLDLPLWYLRDLISTIIISPILYLLLKRLKHWGILLIYILYLLPSIVIPSKLISIPAIFFFGLGMYFAIYTGKHTAWSGWCRLPSPGPGWRGRSAATCCNPRLWYKQVIITDKCPAGGRDGVVLF